MAVVITDENLGNRLAKSLRDRGRPSRTVASLGLKGVEDDELLEGLDLMPDPWVLLTADDRLPWAWAHIIDKLDATIATISPRHPNNYTERQWHHDVAQRWAHTIAQQTTGTIRRYTLNSHRIWTPPRHR